MKDAHRLTQLSLLDDLDLPPEHQAVPSPNRDDSRSGGSNPDEKNFPTAASGQGFRPSSQVLKPGDMVKMMMWYRAERVEVFGVVGEGEIVRFHGVLSDGSEFYSDHVINNWFERNCDVIAPEKDFPTAASGQALSENLGDKSKGSEWHKCYTYRSHGRVYFRYAWGRGHEVAGTHHIPGGAVGNAIAMARAAEVSRWIQLGRGVEEVRGLIRGWSRGKRRG